MYYGKKVMLRLLRKSDLDMFMAHWNDLELRMTLGSVLPFSRSEEEEFIEKTWELKKENKGYVFAITTYDDEFLGTVGLHNVSYLNQSASLGIAIHQKENQRKGYGTDAVITMCGFGFLHQNLNRIELEHFLFNPGGRKAYEKAGFKSIGVRREAFYRNGEFQGLHLMDILKSEWMEKFKDEYTLFKPDP